MRRYHRYKSWWYLNCLYKYLKCHTMSIVNMCKKVEILIIFRYWVESIHLLVLKTKRKLWQQLGSQWLSPIESMEEVSQWTLGWVPGSGGDRKYVLIQVNKWFQCLTFSDGICGSCIHEKCEDPLCKDDDKCHDVRDCLRQISVNGGINFSP